MLILFLYRFIFFRTSKISGAGALSILQTPVPCRKSLSRSRTSTSGPATPQSILKVRQFISNTSPQISPAQSVTKGTNILFGFIYIKS